MNTLDRYLYRTVLVYTAMAMGVLLTLGALFVFISQQSDIASGLTAPEMPFCSRCSICRSRPSNCCRSAR
jgi:lipopolysaccharide export LptBFGC system permease protein LptF